MAKNPSHNLYRRFCDTQTKTIQIVRLLTSRGIRTKQTLAIANPSEPNDN